MAALAGKRREERPKRRLLPVIFSALIAVPNSPLAAAAAVQPSSPAARPGNARSAASFAPAIAPLALSLPLSVKFTGVPAPSIFSVWNPPGPTTLHGPDAENSPPPLLPAAKQVGGVPRRSGLAGASGWSELSPDAPTRGPTAAEDASKNGRALRTEAFAKQIADELGPSVATQADIPPAAQDSPDVPPYPSGAPRTLAEATLDIPSDRTYAPSPDWHKQILESLVIDRYERGPGSQPQGDPNDNNSRHGGTLKGIVARLDYLQKKGVTALMITPVVMGPSKEVFGYYGYHGYWPIHFLAVDPHLGTLADLQELRRETRKRGMSLVLDLVVNHAGPVFDYTDPAPFDENGQTKEIKEWTLPLWPEDLRGLSHFAKRGVIKDWTEKAKELGDFPPNLRKLDLSDPETQKMMIHVAKWWIKEADLDGYRLDTFQHVDPSFWPVFEKEVAAYAKKLGKHDFLFIPEIYHGDPKVIAASLQAGNMKAAYNYPAWFWEKDALHGEAPTRRLQESLDTLKSIFGGGVQWLVRFLENQDRPRFLGSKDPAALLHVALAHVLFSVGIPLLYHGTEALFRSESDVDTGFFGSKREDMWGHFDEKSPMYLLVARLIELRNRHDSLQRGEQYVRWSDPFGAGIYAFSRIHGKKEVLIGENTSDQPRSATMYLDRDISPPGTVLVDELDASYRVIAKDGPAGGSVVTLDMPGHGVRVMVQRPTKE